jgi:hypothetical protein
MPSKLTTEKFIEKSKIKHGDKYDYSKVVYTLAKDKVTIICKTHGEFIQTASDHLGGCGCQECDPTKRFTGDTFIEKSKLIHGDKFDYSKVVYGKNNYDPVEILCKTHGHFMQRPWQHLRGQGCPKCSNNTLMTNEQFIERCREKHADKWDYSITQYSGRRKEVSIICKKHGVFNQKAMLHLDGWGCRKCKTSRLEDYLSNKLNEIREPFKRDKRFEDCKNKNPLPFDFYLPLRNILVECDGIQHREAIPHFGGEERLEYQLENDKIKTNWTKKNAIQLFRLSDNLQIDDFIEKLKVLRLEFDKSVLKDLSLDRTKPLKIERGYLSETDFNWYKKRNYLEEIDSFIQDLGINYTKDFNFENVIINFVINDIYILVVENFRDCEINKKKDWLQKLKDKLEAENKNLVAIYPEDWIVKTEIVKSRIKNILGLNQFRIGARECKIIIPDNKAIQKFLTENHIQGHVNSSVKIALTYEGEIVSLMTFGKLRKNLGQTSKTDSYELLRFCNKSGYTVVGSATRLFSYFKKKWKPKYILSYADRCWTSIHKNVYMEIGMNLVSKTPPSYCYLVGDKKWDRYRYRKDKLIEFGYDSEKWTERSICSSNLVFKIFDAGCLKYEINL